MEAKSRRLSKFIKVITANFYYYKNNNQKSIRITFTNCTINAVTNVLLDETFRIDDIDDAKRLCGDNYQCKYDYAMSLNRDLADFTKNYYNSWKNIRDTNSKRGT